MDLSRWRLFLLVSEFGSISRAAVVLEKPQSYVSRQLIALEKACGGQLFHRTGRGVTLSQLGETITPQVEAILKSADNLAMVVQAQAGLVSGRVSVGMLPALTSSLVAPLVREMRARYPDVRLALIEGNNRALGDLLTRGDVDVGLLIRDHGNLLPTEEALMSLRVVVVSRPGDPFTAPGAVRFSDLAGLPLVAPSPRSHFGGLLGDTARRLGIELNIAVEANSPALQKQLILAGEGYGVMTRQAVGRELAQGQLAGAFLTEPKIEHILALCRTTARPLTPAVRDCVRLIKTLVSELVTP